MLRCLFRRVSIASRSSLLKPSSSRPLISRSTLGNSSIGIQYPLYGVNSSWVFRNLSHGSVNLVISGGKTKFETQEVEPPKKYKWKTKKKLKLQRKREKQKRKFANKRDPRRLGVKGQKRRQRFANAEERIKYKLERARIKEAQLVERLQRYEVAKLQGPVVKPHDVTGEERFYMKKMAQKGSNYVPVGRRGIFGGVILNMHMHWKKHETVKVICKPCKPGQVQQYAEEIARLSGGIPIHIIGDDTIIFYRGKDYVQPRIMSPIDTLSKKRALEKSKYKQSLESVRRFIAIAEKELELYFRHIALYGNPNDRNPIAAFEGPRKSKKELPRLTMLGKEDGTDIDFTDEDPTDIDDNFEDEISSVIESDFDDVLVHEFDDKDRHLTKMGGFSNERSIRDEVRSLVTQACKSSLEH